MSTKPKVFLVLAAVITASGAYLVRRAWCDAACPNERAVRAALALHVDPQAELLNLGVWPAGLRLDVGAWEFFVGDPTDEFDRVVLYAGSLTLVARPTTALSRGRVWLKEALRGGRGEYTGPMHWYSPD